MGARPSQLSPDETPFAPNLLPPLDNEISSLSEKVARVCNRKDCNPSIHYTYQLCAGLYYDLVGTVRQCQTHVCVYSPVRCKCAETHMCERCSNATQQAVAVGGKMQQLPHIMHAAGPMLVAKCKVCARASPVNV